MTKITVIGAGLAGSEAAWQIAKLNTQVDLYEMRPKVKTPAHKSANFAELVCSNSLRGAGLENAVGLLKEEMRRMDSLVMEAADRTKVPAGGALAVDRQKFSEYITEKIINHPLIHIINEEVTDIPCSCAATVVASGPLTSPALSAAIAAMTGGEYLYFYDAAAPIVTFDSLNMDKAYKASRYDKGDDDYINCPMNREEYEIFWDALVNAEKTPTKDFEKAIFFEGCMPVEELARRGVDTLRYGPLKPVGLKHPVTGERPYAVVQLRQDNFSASLYNIVGFQTHLKWPEQKRVFQLIPGLDQAEFVRYGVMHRNTFINSPMLLEPTLQMKTDPNVFFAGQMTGVEGYIESAAAGLVAGVNAARSACGKAPLVFPPDTAHGALCRYITSANAKEFQPMNINFGLLPPLEKRVKDKRLKNRMISERALASLETFAKASDLI